MAGVVRLRWMAIGLVLMLLISACSDEPASDSEQTTAAAGDATPSPAPSPLPEGGSIVVNSAADSDARDDALTLREAILMATGLLDTASLTGDEAGNVEGAVGAGLADTISFAGVAFPSEGGEAIVLGSPLPDLSGGYDTIDGGGATVISGGSFSCLRIDSRANAVRGLMIRDCDTAVILSAEARDNVIGGVGDGQGNVISGNRVGIEIRGVGNRVQGNLIGLDVSGRSALPNRAEGIWIAPGAQDNVVGGSTPGARNVISGNSLFGVSIDGSAGTGQGPTRGNVIEGNYIGTDASGLTALPNQYGVNIQRGALENVVGDGDGEGEANVIAGNSVGIIIRDEATQDNVIRGNYLGLTAGGAALLPNTMDIWMLEGAGENVVEDNLTELQP